MSEFEDEGIKTRIEEYLNWLFQTHYGKPIREADEDEKQEFEDYVLVTMNSIFNEDS